MQGLMLHAIIHSAGVQDRDGGILLLATLSGQFPFLGKLVAGRAYQGPIFANALAKVLPCIETEIVKRPDQGERVREIAWALVRTQRPFIAVSMWPETSSTSPLAQPPFPAHPAVKAVAMTTLAFAFIHTLALPFTLQPPLFLPAGRRQRGHARIASPALSLPQRGASVLTHSFASRFGECFFGLAVLDEDGFGTCRPCERLRVLVSMLDPFGDRRLEFGDIVEGSSPYTLSGDFGEETFDHVEPGAGCRREVQLEAPMSCQPVLHGRRFVGGVIIEDQMQIEMGGRLSIDLFEESQELVCPMAWHTFADNRARCHIERGEERRGAVAFVIMGHGSGAALLQRQTGLGAIERLDLAFLVDGQHQRLLRRVEVEADDILDLFGEVGIVGDLEALHEMRLEAIFGPDALYARVTDAHRFGHGPHAPMRRIDRTLLHGLFDDLELDRGADRLPARRFGAAFDETFDAGFDEIVLPPPHGGLRNPGLAHDRHDAATRRRHQDDPRAFGDLLRRVTISEQIFEFAPDLPVKCKLRFMFHATSESHFHQCGIQLFVTEH